MWQSDPNLLVTPWKLGTAGKKFTPAPKLGRKSQRHFLLTEITLMGHGGRPNMWIGGSKTWTVLLPPADCRETYIY